MDVEAIQKICDDYLKYLESDDYFEDNDWKNHIYELVMKAVYGVGIWGRLEGIRIDRMLKKKRDEINKIQAEIDALQ